MRDSFKHESNSYKHILNRKDSKASDTYLEKNNRNFYNYISKKQKYNYKDQFFNNMLVPKDSYNALPNNTHNYDSEIDISKNKLNNSITPTSPQTQTLIKDNIKKSKSTMKMMNYNDPYESKN